MEPLVARLKEAFNFLPSWRIDDIMVSYASEEGGVGPHFDYYDVFLIQGAGKDGGSWVERDEHTALIEGAPLNSSRILNPQTNTSLSLVTCLCAAGNRPQRHCNRHSITLSVGFRSPTRAELFDDLATDLLFESASHHYRDPPLTR